MQFCNKYFRHLVATWESHYIPYHRLKASLKAGNRDGDALFHDVYDGLSQAVAANMAFAMQLHSALKHDEEQLENRWNDSALANHRSHLIYLDFTSLQEALMELLWFYRINHEATNRIHVKLIRFGSADRPDLAADRCIIQGHLEGYMREYNKCADQLDQVQARLARYQSEKSVSRVDSQQLDQDCQVVAAISRECLFAMGDIHGQSPLHFGATHGMINLCTQVLSTINSIEQHVLLQNEVGLTPLHVSVARGHVKVAQLLLSAIEKPLNMGSTDLLHIALRREDDATVKLLVSWSVGLEHKSSSGESCLYIAAQLGREDYLRLLLTMLGSDSIDDPESACQWTPLFIACVEGHTSTVRLLIDAGADATRRDYLGWTAQENAAFRGHLGAANLFSTIDTTSKLSISRMSNDTQRMHAIWSDVNSGLTHIIINLGSLQEKERSNSSTLNLIGMLGHGLILSISTSESAGSIERTIPLLDDPVDDTFVFAVKRPVETAIFFDVRTCCVGRDEHSTVIGAGIAFLNTHTTNLGHRHSTLLREQSVPILCKRTMRLLGTITFSYVIVGPYHQLGSPSPSITCLGTTGSSQLVGHRGLGQNCRERFLQLGENTIESFLAAAKQGAKYVEFDVQITKDLVPVLFHDYSLSESGTDIAIHDVTLDQFMHTSGIESPRANPPSIFRGAERDLAHGNIELPKLRSRSVAMHYDERAEQTKYRMKHTVDYLQKGFKPNTRGDFIHNTFATLKDALCKLPEEIGLDMEIKYPRVHEAFEAGIAPISIEINIFVDTILDVIAHFGRGRNIILSSFTPDICILLAIKQRSYPVLFITNAGKRPLSDKERRASSLQLAVRFAKQWGLAGIVVAADSLVMCPRLINFIKRRGLICGTYNGLNNEPANVELQVKAGMDLIVADRVGLVSQILKKLKD